MTEIATDPFAAEVDKLHEAIEQAEHVTLEIGTGMFPMTELPGGFRPSAENIYIGLNVGRKAHDHLMKNVAGPYSFAIYTDLRDRESITDMVPAASVDSLVMANIFGEPDAEGDVIVKNWTYSDDKSKLQTLATATKLLKPGGQVFIVETNTPSAMMGDEAAATEALSALGFEQVKFTKRDSPDYFEERVKSGIGFYGEADDPESFIVTARKP